MGRRLWREIASACAELSWPLEQATPGRPQTNGIAERAVRACLEGTRTILEQSGLSKRWWSRASRYFTLMYNATMKDENGSTAWARRFGQPATFPLIPFGSLVHYKSGTKKHNAGENKFGPSSSRGLYMGCYMHDGSRWSKDFLVVDLDLDLDLAGHAAEAAELALLVVVVRRVELGILIRQLN